MEWSNALSVNVVEIDDQHKNLITMVNQLNSAMKTGKGKEATAEIIKNLAEYTLTHFKTEELYFDKFQYLYKLQHVLEHKKFVEKVSQFKNDFDKGKVLLSMEIMNFLQDWLVNHIQKSDKNYQKCFNEHGLK